jgi:uncharacterized protein (AIM24 family)
MMVKVDRARTETRHGRSYVIHTSNAVSLKIVPVKVTKGGITVETYAMIDSNSDVTFCSDSLIKKLKVTGEKKPLILTTMSNEVQREACSSGRHERFPGEWQDLRPSRRGVGH